MPTIKRRLFEGLRAGLLWSARMRAPHHYYWALIWNVTYRCMLKCDYCSIRNHRSETNVEHALDVLRRIRPKIVIFSGGEPFLIGNLHEVARICREEIGIGYLAANTNLVTPVDVIAQIFPYIRTIHVSLDGPGEVHRTHKGISGDVVLNRLQELLKAIRGSGQRISVMIQSVVMAENYAQPSRLVSAVRDISPDVWITFCC